jgi:hypothetical protein
MCEYYPFNPGYTFPAIVIMFSCFLGNVKVKTITTKTTYLRSSP